MSLTTEINNLINPTPNIFDDEGDLYDINETFPSESNNVEGFDQSQLRSKTAPLLENIDPSYTGKKVSRKSLGLEPQKKEKKVTFDLQYSSEGELSDFDVDSDLDASDDLDSSNIIDSEDEGGSDDFSDNDIKEFKNLVSVDASSDGEEQVSQGDDDIDNDDKEEEDEESSESEEIENNSVAQQINIDISSEIEKAKAVKKQKDIWNSLLECRIKAQKLLVLVNKLPQGSYFENIKKEGGMEFEEDQKKACECINAVLDACLDIDSILSGKRSENEISNNANDTNKMSYSDEEIASDSDAEIEHDMNEKVENKSVKRKRKWTDRSVELSKRFNDLIPYRNSVIQKWDEKSRLSAGRMTEKSFNAFNNSSLKQIEQVLQDKTRLIKRTQLKRSPYTIIGKEENKELNGNEAIENMSTSKQDMLLKDYDTEIFDDDDFYRQLLKDVIDSKSFGIDPSILQKQMEIQKMRNKMKRKVDTRASKGRKLRFDIHPKLVNFMAPVQIATYSDDARENLFNCLFGRNPNEV